MSEPVAAHLVTPFLFPTGSWIYSQVSGLERYRARVVTGRIEDAEQFPWPDIQVVAEPIEGRRARYAPAGLARAAARTRALGRACRGCAVAHAHFGPEAYHAVAALRLARVPLVASFYGYDLTQLPEKFPVWRARYARLFRYASAVLVEGSHMRETLVALGCPPEKARVQHLGVPLDRIPFTPRRHPEGPVRVLLAASLREKKGVVYGLEGIARARQAGADLRLTLIGEGPEEPAVARAISELGLADAVVRRPYVTHAELLDELARHDLFLQPSVTAADGDAEGGAPVTVIEAAASGLPIVSTRHCDIPEVVVDGSGGLLAPERDAEAIASRLVELVRRADEWPVFGAFNREHIEREYDLQRQLERLERIYDDAR